MSTIHTRGRHYENFHCLEQLEENEPDFINS